MKKKSFAFCLVVWALALFINTAVAQTLQTGVPAKQPVTKDTVKAQKDTDTSEFGKDVTILSDKTVRQKDGRYIRYIKYKQGSAIIDQQVIVQAFPSLGERSPVNVDTLNPDSLMVYIDKTDYLLAVIYKRKRIRQYRAVFGPDRLKDKMREGDRCTPEGWFKVVEKHEHGNWQRFILLNYPNAESYKKFNERLADHLIPSNSRIGGAVGIHGTFKGGDKLVDMGIGWTDGCIALKPEDIIDLYRFVRPGTRVYVKR
jgi:lipoprotein-anchoring transpeptidase ErfK/SrfK